MEQKRFSLKELLKKDITFPGANEQDKDSFFESLAEMLSSGIDIIVALESLKEETKSKKIYALCDELKTELENGSPIWKALDKRNLLPPHLLTLVKIGEESGNLAKNLKVVIDQQEKDRDFRGQLRSASLYPVFVLVLMFIVGGGVALFVLPRLSTVYKSLNVELPFITKVMIALGDFLNNYGIWAVIVIVLLFAGGYYMLFINKTTKLWGQKLTLHIPIIGRLIEEVELTRMGYLIGTLLNSGFPVVDSFNILANSTNYVKYQQFYAYIAEFIHNGWSFKQTFESNKKVAKILPVYPRQLIITGEKSGNLGDSFLKISEVYAKKNEDLLKNVGSLFEPVLLLIIWVGVAAIALAVILPIYSLIGNLTTISSGGGV